MSTEAPRRPRDEVAVGLVVAPAFGEKGSFVPLGLAHLNGALRGAGFIPQFCDVSRHVRTQESALYADLVEVGFSPDEGGFFGPNLPLLLQVARPRHLEPGPLAERILASAERAADTLADLDMALITVWDSNLVYVLALGRALRQRGVPVVCGGPSTALEPLRQLLVRLGGADVVVVGEGEQRVVELAEQCRAGAPLDVAGALLAAGDGQLIDRPTPPDLRIHDIPRASFESMNVDDWLPLITSRGCIRDCSFCTEKFVWRRYRQRRVESVLDELEHLVEHHGTERFEFNDDLLNGHPKWLERFCRGVVERRLPLRWIAFMEPYRLSPELLDLVAEAGCTLVKYGVQHFDKAMLKTMGRGSEVTDVIDTLVGTAARGIRVDFDLVPGHPRETEAQHRHNVRVLADVLDRDPRLRVNVNPFLLLYGSPVERNPTRYGVDIDYWTADLFPEALQSELADLAGLFIRGYAQDPARDTVRERAVELERVARQASFAREARVVAASDAGVVELRAPVAPTVVIRPESGDTPREVLTAIHEARQHHRWVAVETVGAPFHRAAFCRRARAAGADAVIVTSVGTASDDLRGRAIPAARAEGLSVYLRFIVGSLQSEPNDSVESAVRQARAWTAAGAVLDLHGIWSAVAEPASGGFDTLNQLAARWRASARAAGLPLWVVGAPGCVTAEGSDESAEMLPPWLGAVCAADDRVSRWAQAAPCRSCSGVATCGGVAADALVQWGHGALRPKEGRPQQPETGAPLVTGRES